MMSDLAKAFTVNPHSALTTARRVAALPSVAQSYEVSLRFVR
jgi:hypothetical protein